MAEGFDKLRPGDGGRKLLSFSRIAYSLPGSRFSRAACGLHSGASLLRRGFLLRQGFHLRQGYGGQDGGQIGGQARSRYNGPMAGGMLLLFRYPLLNPLSRLQPA